MRSFTISVLAIIFVGITAKEGSTLPTRTIYEDQAQGLEGPLIELLVSPGYGANINLIPTGAVVKKAWLDNPTRIVISFDGNMCSPTGTQQEQDRCANNTGATVIHLKQIKPLNFPNQTVGDGGTLLTLVAQGAGVRKLYQFRVVPVDDSGQPSYTTLIIRPESDRPQPLILKSPWLRKTSIPATVTPSYNNSSKRSVP